MIRWSFWEIPIFRCSPHNRGRGHSWGERGLLVGDAKFEEVDISTGHGVAALKHTIAWIWA